jgi:hypothetical protein
MKFLKPTQISDALLISSTRAENDYTAWASGTTYALAAKCISTTTHRIYESVQAGNLNHAVTDTVWWLDIGPTNRWAMFDQKVGTITSQATPLTVVLAPGVVNSLALLDISATSVTVSMTDGVAGPTVFNQTYPIHDGAEIVDWYGYFFEPLQPQTELIVEGLPPYASGRITVAITAGTTAECGTLAVGTMTELGGTRYGVGLGIIDYSKKETDVFGVTSVIERSYAKKLDIPILVDNGRLDYITRRLAAVRATPCVWIGSDLYSSLIAYGFYKDWGLSIPYPNHSEMNLTIEGLT